MYVSGFTFRGSIVLAVREVIHRAKGDSGWHAFLERLPAPHRAAFESTSIVATTKVDYAAYRAMGESVISLWGEDEFRRMGGEVALVDLGRGMRFVLGVVSPEFAAARLPAVYSHYFSFGEWANTHLEKGQLEATITKHERASRVLCLSAWGWSLAALKQAGAKNATCEHRECLFAGGHACRFVYRWS